MLLGEGLRIYTMVQDSEVDEIEDDAKIWSLK